MVSEFILSQVQILNMDSGKMVNVSNGLIMRLLMQFIQVKYTLLNTFKDQKAQQT
jgi:hypothetical protein